MAAVNILFVPCRDFLIGMLMQSEQRTHPTRRTRRIEPALASSASFIGESRRANGHMARGRGCCARPFIGCNPFLPGRDMLSRGVCAAAISMQGARAPCRDADDESRRDKNRVAPHWLQVLFLVAMDGRDGIRRLRTTPPLLGWSAQRLPMRPLVRRLPNIGTSRTGKTPTSA